MSRHVILVVDDDANLVQGLELTLRKEYRLLAAGDCPLDGGAGLGRR